MSFYLICSKFKNVTYAFVFLKGDVLCRTISMWISTETFLKLGMSSRTYEHMSTDYNGDLGDASLNSHRV